jgi:hypothetical protein
LHRPLSLDSNRQNTGFRATLDACLSTILLASPKIQTLGPGTLNQI